MRGVHPENKLPGTYTQIPYCKLANSYVVSSQPVLGTDLTFIFIFYETHQCSESIALFSKTL